MPTLTNRRGKMRWRAQIKRNGKSLTKWFGPGRLGGTEHKKALAWEEAAKVEWDKALAVPQIPTASLIEWAEAYLDHVMATRSPKTYSEKRFAFKVLFQRGDITPDMTVSEFTIHHALRHLRLQSKERGGNAANKDRKNLGHAWKWGRTYMESFPHDETVSNPFRAVPTFAAKHKARYVPPEGDFWRVLGVLTGQDRVMLLTFLHLGARRGEVFRLRWTEDILFQDERIRVMTRKTRDGSEKYSMLPMTGELKGELLWWWEHRPIKSAENVFLNLADNQFHGQPFKHRNKFLHVACAKAGVRRFGFHAIRHLTASILFREGHSVSVIQRILRHESPNTTERYLRSLGFDTDLEEAVKSLEGRGPAKVLPFAQKKASGSAISRG